MDPLQCTTHADPLNRRNDTQREAAKTPASTNVKEEPDPGVAGNHPAEESKAKPQGERHEPDAGGSKESAGSQGAAGTTHAKQEPPPDARAATPEATKTESQGGRRTTAGGAGESARNPSPIAPDKDLPKQSKSAGKARKAEEYDGCDEDSESDPRPQGGAQSEPDVVRVIASLATIVSPYSSKKAIAQFGREISELDPNGTQVDISMQVGNKLFNSMASGTGISGNSLSTIVNVITAIVMSPVFRPTKIRPHQVLVIEEDILSLLSMLSRADQKDIVRNHSHYFANNHPLSPATLKAMLEDILLSQKASVVHAVMSGITALRKTASARQPFS